MLLLSLSEAEGPISNLTTPSTIVLSRNAPSCHSEEQEATKNLVRIRQTCVLSCGTEDTGGGQGTFF